ncbi:acyltransferase domain-containing protein [Cellvibrio sp. QJXJ]|uniref:acyltransferase domain-containing protein n=1 Tax=Cellvibrio sp. QJXJ TaxID=2964606 RepID=UPI0039658E3A
MGRDLFDSNHFFKRHMTDFDEQVEALAGFSLLDTVYNNNVKVVDPFSDPLKAGLSIYMVETSLVKMLADYDIRPDYVIGASLGLVAACTSAQCLSQEQGIRLLIDHGNIFKENCQEGKMLAILESVETYNQSPLLCEYSELAAINFNKSIVISIPYQNVSVVEKYLKRSNYSFQALPVSKPYHSQWMDAVQGRYKKIYNSINYSRPSVPVFCTVATEVLDSISPDSLWTSVRGCMQFEKTIKCIEDVGGGRYIDVGPSGTMVNFLKYILPNNAKSKAFQLLSPFKKGNKNLDSLLNDCQVNSVNSSYVVGELR